MQGSPLLTVITFLPLLGGILLFLVPRGRVGVARTVAMLFALADVALTAYLAWAAHPGASFQFQERAAWLPGFFSYHLGADWISIFLLLLTSVSFLVSIAASRGITQRGRAYLFLMLLAETACLGLFVSLDLFLFYIFWEVMLVPIYLLIIGWGGANRRRAATKFLIYNLAASLLMLVALVWVGIQNAGAGHDAWGYLSLLHLHLPAAAQLLPFLAFSLAFAVKMPLFPFHTWMPDAYAEAPAPVTAVLSGVLSKAGLYGFLRLGLPLFPAAAREVWPWVAGLAIIGVIYGSLIALAERDAKRLVGYASLAHLGIILLGIFAFDLQGLEGGVLQMVNHGVYVVALFLLLGMIEERAGTRDVTALGGLAVRAPVLAASFLIVALAALGLPGLNGFAGEFLILLGVFQTHLWLAVAAMLGVILASAYMIRLLQAAFHGPRTFPGQGREMSAWEFTLMVPLLFIIFWIGIAPRPIPAEVAPTAHHLVAQVSYAPPSGFPGGTGR